MKRLLFIRALVALLILSLSLAQPLLAREEGGLFSKLKAKASEKISQLKSKDWWKITLSGKATAFVGGKVIGLAGMALGGALGLLAGPAGAAVGALVGYRLGSIAGSTFARPIGKDLARDKIAGDDDLTWSDVKDSWNSQDKKALAVEAGAGIVGDFLGEV
ncbi:MAG TPA: hypothetical protein PKO06_24150, partial [Candidatus Ozemobacteraceae bacterium]|nr:hypothetical protein [Candidatus Ozemobacteraceae bacterium]